jgi:hypothetical protein
MKKTFILGLGGQKCGSSWYQSLLARQPDSDFGKLTEYHVWDDKINVQFPNRKKIKIPFSTGLSNAIKWHLGRPISNQYLRWRLQNNKEEYFNYFEKLLSKPSIFRTGDVTPIYAALSKEVLHEIKNGFDVRHIKTKVIFSMRDPVSRLRSHLYMNQQKGYLKASADFNQDLKDFYSSPEAEARMRYDDTILAIHAVFKSEDSHLCLFEEMLTPKGVESLSEFAGIEYDATAYHHKLNARESLKIDLSEEIEKEISHHYRKVYDEVYKKFPQILTLWPSAKYLFN